MKRIACVLVIAACAPTPPSPPTEPAVIDVEVMRTLAPAPHVAPAYAAATMAASARAGVVTSLHGEGVIAIAVVEGGGAAVTADAGGSVRLWPTFDGTREPVVVAMRAPHLLAITRDRDGFAIAGLDELGQLEVVRTANSGASEARIAIAAPRPFVAVHALAETFLVQRDDGRLVAFDLHGVVRGELVAEAGERIVDVAVRAGRVLAVIEQDAERFGRWVRMTPAVAWGERTGRLPIGGRAGVALSADGARLAAAGEQSDRFVIVALAIGTELAHTNGDEAGRPIGFLADGALAIERFGEIVWWVDNVTSSLKLPRGRIAATTDTALVTGDIELVVQTPADAVALGYRGGTITQLLRLGDDWLATDTRNVMVLDAKLHTKRVLALGGAGMPQYGWTQIQLLTTRDALAHGEGADYLLDLDGKLPPRRDKTLSSHWLLPHAEVVAGFTNDAVAIARFDPNTRTLSRPSPLYVREAKHSWQQIVVLDPESHGMLIGVIEIEHDPAIATLYTASAFDPLAEQPLTVTSHSVPLTAEGLPKLDDLRTIVPHYDHVVRKSPDGTLVADVGEGRLTLRTAAGAMRWVVPAHGATSLAWSARGELVAIGGGLAIIDLASGRMRDRQCGFAFGVRSNTDGVFSSAELCTAS